MFSLYYLHVFEKNEKEPKKNGKRKQKERNSVTTTGRQGMGNGWSNVGRSVRKRARIFHNICSQLPCLLSKKLLYAQKTGICSNSCIFSDNLSNLPKNNQNNCNN